MKVKLLFSSSDLSIGLQDQKYMLIICNKPLNSEQPKILKYKLFYYR